MIPRPGSQVGNLFIIYLIFFWKKKIPRKERNDPSTWFPSWQFMCRRQHQRGNPSQSQSLFLTFSFHQTCKIFCKIFEKHFWQPFSIPKSFFDFQFPPNMQNVVQNIWKTFLATLLNPQSIFLTFSFYHNLQNILQTSEGNQSSWIAIIY